MRERPLYPCVNLFIWPLWPENFNPLPLRLTVIYFSHNITPESHIKATRIKKMITN